jgi:hypothetical protein
MSCNLILAVEKEEENEEDGKSESVSMKDSSRDN